LRYYFTPNVSLLDGITLQCFNNWTLLVLLLAVVFFLHYLFSLSLPYSLTPLHWPPLSGRHYS
jgi:hypothetical protein